MSQCFQGSQGLNAIQIMLIVNGVIVNCTDFLETLHLQGCRTFPVHIVLDGFCVNSVWYVHECLYYLSRKQSLPKQVDYFCVHIVVVCPCAWATPCAMSTRLQFAHKCKVTFVTLMFVLEVNKTSDTPTKAVSTPIIGNY